MNIFHILEKSSLRYPTHSAIYSGVDAVCSYQQLREASLCLASSIRKTCEVGSRIGILAKNCPEYIEVLFAIWAAGAIAVPLNCKLHEKEVVGILGDAECQLVFISKEFADPLSQAGAVAPLIELGGPKYAAMRCAAPMAPIETSTTDTAWLFYTSGTTGLPKGAMLSHRNLLAMTLSHLADFEDISNHHNLIHAAPMSHGSGLYMLPYIARAAANVIPRSVNYDPGEVLRLSAIHKGCGIFLAPTMVQRLRLAAQSKGDIGSLRSVLYGGGPMYLDEIKKCLDLFGPIFIQLYGQGEAPVTITGLRRRDHVSAEDSQLSSVGWARSGMEVAVVDDDGTAAPVDTIGEVVCRGDVVMSGYWKNAQASAEALRNGWLWTGDMGSMDQYGMLTLRDRSKDVIISGGTNIYPREVEEVLLQHPCVVEACVVGKFDEEWGEIVVAYIVLDQDLDQEVNSPGLELDRHCLENIARFKRPKEYLFVEELPKSPYGKVLKRELVSQPDS